MCATSLSRETIAALKYIQRLSIKTKPKVAFKLKTKTKPVVTLILKIASEMPVPHSLGKYFQHHEI